ncbi:MAG: tripartite tricarboxylate transporter substrate-binding protein [Rhizobiaceae bacterium]
MLLGDFFTGFSRSEASGAPLTTTAGAQMGIVALSSSGWKTINDVIADAKSGRKIHFGVMSPRLANLAFLLGKAQGVAFNIISLKGGRAVMNGINAGDTDIGFIAGIQAKGVAAGDLFNLGSAMSTPLKQTPDAPLIEDLSVSYDGNAYFMFVAPGEMAGDARNALESAIADVASDESTKVCKLIKRAFGGSMTIQSKEPEALVKIGYDESPKLMKEASE